MVEKTITREKTGIERILIRQKQEVAKNVDTWRKRNKKYFKDWDSVKAIRILRYSNGRP